MLCSRTGLIRPLVARAWLYGGRGARRALSSSRVQSQDNNSRPEPSSELPLAGIKVLELGQLIAGPFGGQLLGHFGAEVIKVEPLSVGDPIRTWRELDKDGVSIWSRSISRNKKSVTIDMRKDEGKKLVKKLAIRSDILLENFKPGTLEKWGLGPSDIHPHNPDLIFARVSGYGQTGPWSYRGGYASVCEAETGFRYVNGFPDENGMLSGPPVRPNISLGDSVAGLHAAFGVVLALLSREKRKANGKIGGQTVDISIMESVMNLMEGVIPEYSRKGVIRGPSGSSITGIVPTNAYPTSIPSAYVVIGANVETMYERLMTAIGRPDLLGPDFAGNHNRVVRRAEVEDGIIAWTSQRTPEEVCKVMDEARVPAGRIMNAQDVVENQHVRERGMIERIHVPFRGKEAGSEADAGDAGWDLDVPRVAPILECDAPTRWAGPDLGQHNEEVLKDVLGLSGDDISGLRARGVVGEA